MTKQELKDKFAKIYNIHSNEENQLQYFFSPARINLIGEHIDYNGGFVFPAAITFGTYGAISKRTDTKVRLFSQNFADQGIITFDITELEKKADDNWTKYVKAVIWAFGQAGYQITNGFDAYIEGNIPNGAGLSSSASIELLISEILDQTNNLDIKNMIEKVQLSQKAENQYVGVNCGIMDQFAIGMGKKDHAIKLNTNDLSYEYVEADLHEFKILIMDTKKKRELADSKYNQRRQECEAALSILKKTHDIQYLCDLEWIEPLREINDPVLYKRAKHVITENHRVKEAFKALNQQDLTYFGNLLDRSHQSLKEDYEVTGIELDTIVEIAQKQQGIIGARMTGAGFGGCAIGLIDHTCTQIVEEVKKNIAKEYEEKIGYKPDFYICSIGDGIRML